MLSGPLTALFFLATAASPVVSPAVPDDYPRDTRVDVLHYVFRIGLSDATDSITGDATVRVRFREDGVRALRLDLVGRDGAGRGMTVREVLGEEGPLRWRHEGDELRVELREPSRADALAEVRVRYGGTPATGLLIGPNIHGDRTFFSDNWPNKARHWLPTVDHPYDKATSEMVVAAPAHYQVVSNGLLVEETDLGGGMRRTRWRQSVPIATWLNAVGAAPFAVDHRPPWRGRPVQTWVFPEDRETGFEVFAGPTMSALQFFSERVGPYAYEKVGQVQATSVGGGMEAASVIFYGQESATGANPERWRDVIVHELAHQWFGNAVTEADWDEVWLSEGFATYFTLLWKEHALGRAAFVDGLVAARDLARGFYREDPDYRVVHENLTDMSQVSTYPGTYQKGAWVLHMLRREVGDAAFWEGVRLYYGRHMNGNVTVADFRRAMEDASGESLQWFFDQWLQRGGWPTVTARWGWNAARGEVEVTLEQRVSGTGGTMRLPVDVGVHLPGREVPAVTTVELAGPTATVRIPAESRPEAVSLDPETWLLGDVAVEGLLNQPRRRPRPVK